MLQIQKTVTAAVKSLWVMPGVIIDVSFFLFFIAGRQIDYS
jgi:hypothetical protein